jgi:hypothetical protein
MRFDGSGVPCSNERARLSSSVPVETPYIIRSFGNWRAMIGNRFDFDSNRICQYVSSRMILQASIVSAGADGDKLSRYPDLNNRSKSSPINASDRSIPYLVIPRIGYVAPLVSSL